MGKRNKSRVIAFQALYQYDQSESKITDLLNFDWVNNKEKLPLEILLFSEKIISGTIENLNKIDNIIKDSMKNWVFEKISPVDRSILRISVYSLLFQTDIPYIITINEGVDLAQKYGSEKSYQFINGMLDGIQNKLSEIETKNKTGDPNVSF